MGKIFKNIFLFILLLGVFYFGGMYLLSKVNYKGKPAVYITNDYYVWKGGGTYKKFKSKDSLSNRDVIIVGSSRAYRSYNPLLFAKMGVSAWNLGSSAQSIENSYRVIEEVIIPAKPKVILLDLARLGFEQESIESSIDLITNTSSAGLKKRLILEMPDIRLYNTAFTSIINEDLPSLYKDEEYKNAGFSTKKDSLNLEWIGRLKLLREGSKNNKMISDFKVLIDIMELCLKSNQKIILVHSPVSQFYSLIAQENFVMKVDSISQKYKVPFYDFQNMEGINTKNHFYDDSHLNTAGVNVFNEQLLKEVKFP